MHRHAVTALSVLATAGAVAAGATLAAAPGPGALVHAPGQGEAGCAGRVIEDWIDDGLVQGSYRLRCYRAAIKALPEDLRAYSTAPDDLTRAMQGRPGR